MILSDKVEIEKKEYDIIERNKKKYKMMYIGFILFFGLFALVCMKNFPLLVLGAMVFCGILMLNHRIQVFYYEFFERIP